MSTIEGTWRSAWWYRISLAVVYRCAWVGVVSASDRRQASERLRSQILRRVGVWPWAMTVATLMVAGLCTIHVAWADTAQAEDASPDDAIVVTKVITGKVSAINPKDRFLTVIYQQEKEKGVEYELLLTLADKVELQHKQNLNELKYGDTIKVTYAEKQQEAKRQTPDGAMEHYTKVLSREATVIAFLKPHMPGAMKSE